MNQPPNARLNLSGKRFTCTYELVGNASEARRIAEDICVEQTVEFPVDLIARAEIKAQIMGEVRALDDIGPDRHRVIIAYPVETAGRELTQLVNVVFGNISLKPGIKLTEVSLPETLLGRYKGPRFGIDGLRTRLGIEKRPLVATAIKPMGLANRELAELAFQLASGGVDIIKDDHGLADQSFSRFEERVTLVAAAVRRAGEARGIKCHYVPNVTAPADEVMMRARLARDCGAGGVLVAPGLVGLDTQRRLADDDAMALPVVSHPAFQGAFTVSPDSGITPGVLFATFNRLFGADVTVFPNFGGRFSFTEAACRDLNDKAKSPLSHIRSIFPAPAGGMSLDRVGEMRTFYGDDVVLLIGGDMRRHGDSVESSARRFVSALTATQETHSQVGGAAFGGKIKTSSR